MKRSTSDRRPSLAARESAAATHADRLPLRLGPYILHERLAIGGMAEIFLACRAAPSERAVPVAIKRLHPHLTTDGQHLEMVVEEARLVSLIRHENVVRILELGRTADGPFLVMELVAGEPLSEVLAPSPSGKLRLPPLLAVQIVSLVAAAIHHAHALHDGNGRPLRIVHRDISPDNILISFGGDVKLIDFGVAKGQGARSVDTEAGTIKGKLAYMSPEQARAKETDHRSDVFSLGVVLWEALAGERLFRRQNELETLRAVIDAPHPKLSQLMHIDPALEAIVDRALAKDPAQRFQSTIGMRRALERYLAQVSSAAEVGTDALARFMRRSLPGQAWIWDTRMAALASPGAASPTNMARARTADLEALNDEVLTDLVTPSEPTLVERRKTRRGRRNELSLTLLMLVIAVISAAVWF